MSLPDFHRERSGGGYNEFDMLLLALLLVQDADTEAAKLLAPVQGLMGDPLKNAEELDRRFEALRKLLEGTPAFKSREAVLSWMPRLGRKAGRAAEALPFAKERLKLKIEPRHLEGIYGDAIYTAALALKTDEMISLGREIAKLAPDSALGGLIGQLEKDAAALGRPRPAVTAPPYDGSKFAWGGATKDRIVLLYFCASW